MTLATLSPANWPIEVQMQILWSVIVFVFGLLVGSFLNVCIYRLPRGKSLTSPARSYCPTCHEPIAWYDNIPLVSYLALGRVCRCCGSPISSRYFLVELLTAVTVVTFFNVLSLRGETPGTIVMYTAVACLLIVASFIDLDLRIIPDEITIGGMIFAPVLCAVFPSVHDRPDLGRELLFFHDPGNAWLGSLSASLVGMAVGAFIVYGAGLLGKGLFRKEAMGLGDVKFMAFLGAILGWKLILLVFFFSTVPGAIVGLIYMLRTGDHHMAFGPFLSLAAVVVMLAAVPILGIFGIDWILDPSKLVFTP